MSKIWVKTDYVPETNKDYITEDKWYELSPEKTDKENILGGVVIWDDGKVGFLSVSESCHINGKNWTVYKGDIPPVKETKEEKSMIGDTNSIGKISGADWSKAPSGATHVDINRGGNFYVKEEGKWRCFYDQDDGGTFVSGTFPNGDSLHGEFGHKLVSKEDDLGITQINTEPQTEWKIRHIKSDDYKSGRDVAITILYKEIGNGYYEYKFAICSPNDMFSRKKGVAEALKKESDKLYNEGSVPFTGLILMHMSVSNKFSKSARSLILSKMAELV